MEITFDALPREAAGRGDSRRLRREGRTPAIIYGDGDPIMASVDSRKILARLRDGALRSSLVNLNLNGKTIKALAREAQMHPFRREVLHIDFQAVRADSEVAANVPLRFINVEDAPGVKLHHGIFTAVENQVAAHCLPKDLPEFIVVDVGELGIGQNVHLSDIPPPPGVRYDAAVRGEDPVLAIISGAEAEKEEDPAADPTADAATTTPS